VPIIVEGDDPQRSFIAEQQHLGAGRAAGFDVKTIFRDDDIRRDLDSIDSCGSKALDAAIHLDQLGDLCADGGEKEGRGACHGGDHPCGMERSARERQGFLEAVTYSAADLALSTAIDASAVTTETHLAQPLPAASAALAGLLGGVIGAVRGYPHRVTELDSSKRGNVMVVDRRTTRS
jgi:hypothetical protein